MLFFSFSLIFFSLFFKENSRENITIFSLIFSFVFFSIIFSMSSKLKKIIFLCIFFPFLNIFREPNIALGSREILVMWRNGIIMNKKNRHVGHYITHQALLHSEPLFPPVQHRIPIHKQSNYTRSNIKIKKLLEGKGLK